MGNQMSIRLHKAPHNKSIKAFASISEERSLSSHSVDALRKCKHESMFNLERQSVFPNTSSKGINILVLKSGNSQHLPHEGDVVEVEYTAYIGDSDRDPAKQILQYRGCVTIGGKQTIRGLEKAIKRMSVGAEIKLWVPARLAYGSSGYGDLVPPNSNLLVHLKLIQVYKHACYYR